MFKKLLFTPFLLTFFILNYFGQENSQINKFPEKTKFVTTDIENFWRAYDLAKKETQLEKKVEIFQKEYIDKGSIGLKGFLPHRIQGAEQLVKTIEKMPAFYSSIRKPSKRTAKMEKQVLTSFKKLQRIYPEAVFPNVYLVIGRANSGGTTSAQGILIGTEMHCLTQNTPLNEIGDWLKSVLAPIENLPHIIAHESIHYQQQIPQTTLLEKAIQEGGADFIGELISGKNINREKHLWGNQNESKLWLEFKEAMNGKDYSKWMYEGDKAKNRPADMGYYIGYKICEAYYKNSKDKKQAIKDMLIIKDANKFLEQSKYTEKFNNRENKNF